MAFLISDVRKHRLVPGGRYFFDANVWLAILDLTFSTPFMASYEALFNEIVRTESARIVVSSLLLSEILNRYLNDIYYKEFCRLNPPALGIGKAKHFKTVYRTSSQYKTDLAMATAEIKSYSSVVNLIPDQLDDFSLEHLLTDIPLSLDFNDHMYIELAKKQQLIIVTNDADFEVEDVHILSSNRALLKTKHNK